MRTGYAGEVCHAQGHRSRPDTIHIREQAQVERDKSSDGAEDSGSLEDEPGQVQEPGGEHLYEARSIMWFREVILPLIGILLIGQPGRHNMGIELVVFATKFTLIILLTGGPPNTL